MANVQDCENALRRLADILAGVDEHTRRRTVLDRTLSCTIRDLDVIYAGELRDGHLNHIREVGDPDAQIRLVLNSDDLIRLTNGELKFARAWATGKVKVDASVFDLLKLRSLL